MNVAATTTSTGVQNYEVDPKQNRMNLGKDDFQGF